MPSERFQLLLDPDQVSLLRGESARTGKSMSELIRLAIDRTYSSHQRKRAQSLLEELFSLNLPVADWPEMKRQIDEAMLG